MKYDYKKIAKQKFRSIAEYKENDIQSRTILISTILVEKCRFCGRDGGENCLGVR